MPFSADIAVPAHDLDAEIGRLEATVGEALFRTGVMKGRRDPRPPHARRGRDASRQRRDGGRSSRRARAPPRSAPFNGEEHAADIGMDDERIGRLVRRHRTAERAALQAVGGIGPGALIGGLADAEPLHGDAQPGGVHHRKHGAHAGMGLADEIASASSKLITQVADALIPILCSIDAAAHAVAGAERARLRDQELRPRKRLMPRIPAGASGSRARTRWRMLFGEIVLAGRDEDLGAGDLEGVRSRPVRRALRMRPRSVPHCGSVRHIVPAQVPSTICGR